MIYQDEWYKVLTALKSSVMYFVQHDFQDPEKMGEAFKNFVKFVEGNKSVLVNDETACRVVDAFNSILEPPLPSLSIEEGRKKLEILMDSVGEAIKKAVSEMKTKEGITIVGSGNVIGSGNINTVKIHQENKNNSYIKLAKAIDATNGSNEQKDNAKSLLKQLLESVPLISEALSSLGI